MRRFLAVWLLLWAVPFVVGATISVGVFRHIDLSFSALCAALLIPVGQAGVLLVPQLVEAWRKRPSPETVRRTAISPAVTVLLVVDVVMLQLVWLSVGSRWLPVAESLVFLHMLSLHAVAVVVLSIREVVQQRLRTGKLAAAAVGVVASVGAAELYADPLTWATTGLGLSQIVVPLAAVSLVIVGFVGVSHLTIRFAARDPVAGRLANGSLGGFFVAALITVVMLHGGAQLGTFWRRGALTLVLLAVAALIAAWLQVWKISTDPTQPSLISLSRFWWHGAPARKLVLLAVCYSTYLAGRALAGWWFGSLPGLPGETVVKAALIPAVQAAALLGFVRNPSTTSRL